MAQAAMGRAMVAAGGTMLVLGGATMGVSFVAMTVTRVVVEQNKKKKLVTCHICTGSAKLSCAVCDGERTLKYHSKKQAPVNQRISRTACPMCEGAGSQACLNCLGEGKVMPLPITLSDLLETQKDYHSF
mmetsp:Transcript_2486/g.4185  ORF Transcript_2486/g.4185 Transcript_2486/m.4185 type:complete len:130 (+) Transcript_2486:105-494(+)